ncbi:MAG: TolC family protein [bacterium]
MSKEDDVELGGLEEPTGILTLRQALALALMKNPELAVFSWDVRVGEARTLQAGLLPNPKLITVAEDFGGSGEKTGYDGAQTTIFLAQVIRLAGKIPKRTKVASLKRDLAAWDYEAKRLDILTQTAKAFVTVLAAQKRLALTEDLVRLSEQVFLTAQAKQKAGKVSRLEVKRAEIPLSTNKIAWQKAQRKLAAARKILAATWGSTTPAFDRVEGELETIHKLPSLQQLTELISQNPDIARWSMEMELRRANIELEKARAIPDLTVMPGFRRIEETDDNALVLRLAIPIPIFNRNQGGILEAHEQRFKAKESRRQAKLMVKTRLARIYQALSASYIAATNLKTEVLPSAKWAYDAAQEGYSQGKFGYLDVLGAQKTLFETRGQYIDELAAYHLARTEVERMIGQGIDQISEKQEKSTDD